MCFKGGAEGRSRVGGPDVKWEGVPYVGGSKVEGALSKGRFTDTRNF